jgi:hypothetical protein
MNREEILGALEALGEELKKRDIEGEVLIVS